MPATHSKELIEAFGSIDIYLFDQILKGRFDERGNLLDAGCGSGRNLVYFLRKGLAVYGVDRAPEAISQARSLAAHLAPELPADNFRVASVESLPFADASFDAVLSNAVLHFARDTAHFRAMLHAMWRVLKPGGLLFARLASSIGLEGVLQASGNGRYLLPDGSERYLVNLELLLELGDELGGTLLDPVKTSNVQGLRCMTTWVLEKSRE